MLCVRQHFLDALAILYDCDDFLASLRPGCLICSLDNEVVVRRGEGDPSKFGDESMERSWRELTEYFVDVALNLAEAGLTDSEFSNLIKGPSFKGRPKKFLSQFVCENRSDRRFAAIRVERAVGRTCTKKEYCSAVSDILQ